MSDPAPVLKSSAQGLRHRLDAAEEHWIWKISLRAASTVVAIIGIACMAWIVSNAVTGPYARNIDDRWQVVWTFITFGASLIWCCTCILVLLIRRPNAPVHPGAAVGIDLVLWLAYIPTALFALLAAVAVLEFGEDGIIGRYSPYGYYFHADNGTWVWNATEYDTYFRNKRDCSVGGTYSKRYDNYGFSSCAEEDAFVNSLWETKGQRAALEMTGVVCQFLGFILHFALFVWACVDTHKRNSRKTNKEAELLATNIVMNMVRSGAIVQDPARMQRQPQQFQSPATMGAWNTMPPHPFEQRGEKTEQLPRFA